jgi:hypothetical protein
MLTDKQIEKFRELYKSRFKKEISRKEAYRSGMKIITLMKHICNPNKSSK